MVLILLIFNMVHRVALLKDMVQEYDAHIGSHGNGDTLAERARAGAVGRSGGASPSYRSQREQAQLLSYEFHNFKKSCQIEALSLEFSFSPPTNPRFYGFLFLLGF